MGEQNTHRSFDPEEILADFVREEDPKAGDSIETPIPRRSIALFMIMVCGLFSLFAFRAFSLSVLQGSSLLRAAEQAGARTFAIVPLRGAIVDRNGATIVDNASTLTLVFDPLEAKAISSQERDAAFVKAAGILGVTPDDLRSRTVPFTNQAEARVVVPELSQDIAVALAASNLPEFFRVEPSFRRTYPFGGEAFATVAGYVGDVTKDDIAAGGFNPREVIGKAGVEMFYDDLLRGTPGERRVLVDAHGSTKGESIVREPIPGNTLRLTLDAGLTQVSATALEKAIQQSGASGGAVVAVDPRDGAVRSLLSLPSYDASTMSGGIAQEEYQRLVNDPRKPFLDRAIAGLYPSGSTIKPFIGAAALAEQVVSPTLRIDDAQGFIRVASIYNPNVSWTFRDWRVHGLVNFIDAIAESCDVYFYTVGGGYGDVKGLGPERIARYLAAFGFGHTLGVDLPGEVDGRIPAPDWKKATKNEQWFIGDTYNLSIGQGDFLTTPLQLAMGTAAIANGGTLFRPHLLGAVLDTNGKEVRAIAPEVLQTVPISDVDLSWSRRGMRASVTAAGGTNRSLANLPISVAAKTGTAQFGTQGKTHALVTAFAPYENPELVLAIVLDGGGEGTVATHVAGDILTWYAAHRTENSV